MSEKPDAIFYAATGAVFVAFGLVIILHCYGVDPLWKTGPVSLWDFIVGIFAIVAGTGFLRASFK